MLEMRGSADNVLRSMFDSFPDRVNLVLTEIESWAASCQNIRAAGLVGSWARGNARIDSDIDLMFLTTEPGLFRQQDWMVEIDWRSIGAQVLEWYDRDYGLVWSRHVLLTDGTKIEFSFGDVTWASIDPIDPGTLAVAKHHGCYILSDPEDLLQKLIDSIPTQ
jgi:uncharacterized protein